MPRRVAALAVGGSAAVLISRVLCIVLLLLCRVLRSVQFAGTARRQEQVLPTPNSQHPTPETHNKRQAHKCPELAALQLQLLGSVAQGVCAQKVSEVEALVAGGINDVLLSNQVVSHAKIQRLAALAARGECCGLCGCMAVAVGGCCCCCCCCCCR